MMQRPWQNGRYTLIGIALLVVLGILVRQQMSWLNQASESQLASEQKELSLTLAQGLDTVRGDMQQLYNELVTDGSNASDLVEQQWLIRFDQHWPTYTDDDPRQKWVSIFMQSVGDNPNPFELERSFGQHKTANEFLLVSGVRPNIEKNQFDIRILSLDLSILAETVIEPTLKEALANYSFVLSVNQQPLITQGYAKPIQTPDIVMPISRLLQFPMQERRLRSNEALNESALPVIDRDISRLYEMILNTIQQPNDKPQENDLLLEVYSSEGALVDKINHQKWRNSFFSIMVLGLLSVTVMVLLEMTRRIKEQQQRERDFISSISHELRTPLTVIRSAADNLKDGVVSSPESIARYGLEISKQSKRLSRMIDTTLTYSGLPGRDSQQLEIVNGETFFRELFEPLVALAEEQSVSCHLKTENLNRQLTVDSDALRTIGQNLVMNALIHAKPDVGPAHLWVHVIAHAHELVLSVADNGVGIPKKEQRHVFAPFVRGKRSEQNQRPGTGLGLSLVQRTVAILQGRVTLQSPYLSDLGQTEKGCLFTVTLPLGK